MSIKISNRTENNLKGPEFTEFTFSSVESSWTKPLRHVNGNQIKLVEMADWDKKIISTILMAEPVLDAHVHHQN